MESHVGPYRVLRLINQGGQGSVYLGYDKRLRRRVAIKIYPLPKSREARRRILREARLIAGIQSHKVVQIHDLIESDTHLAMVMEYVPGCSVEELLASTRPSLSSVLTVGIDVAGALALARQNRIVHGDVKAGNVLVSGQGRAKLTDFGIARTTTAGESPARWRAGSFSTLSPEQLLGKPLDERADLFALGCLLYRMLCGEHPFYRHGQPDPDLLLNQSPLPLTERVSGDVELPEPLLGLIAELLEKDPQRRPRNTRRVRQVLRAIRVGLPVSAADSLLREARPFFRRESPDDIPPPIPRGLGEQGRSALPHSGSRLARVGHWLKTRRWPVQVALSLSVLGLLATPVAVALHDRVTPVQFDVRHIVVTPGVGLPPGVTQSWLVEQVKQALRERPGRLRVIGHVGADPLTVLYADGEPRNWFEAPELSLTIALHCVETVCVLALGREQGGVRGNRQAVLLADMSREEWEDIVRDTTLALYR